MSQNSTKERKRIAKACDLCRKKKIKCNGACPCLNCTNYNNVCLYTYVGKRDTTSKVEKPRSPPKVANKSLESRIDKIEMMINKIVNKMDGYSNNIELEQDNFNSSIANEQEFSGSDNDDDETSPTDSPPFNHVPFTSQSSQQFTDPPNKPYHDPLSGSNRRSYKYMSLLSPKGLSWIASKTSTSLIAPFETLIKESTVVEQNVEKKWIDYKPPISPSLSKEQLTVLLRIFMSYFSILTVYDPEFFEEVFEKYSNNQTMTNNEYFVVYSTLLLSIGVQFDSTPDPALNLTKDQLNYLISILYNNCIYYYYKTNCFGQSIETIQAIIILLNYGESPIYYNNKWILLTTAVSIAKDSKLNKLETARFSRNSKVWWHLYFADKELSSRLAKFPLINEVDNTTSIPLEFQKCLNGQLNERGEDENVRKLVKVEGFDVYFFYYSCQLSQIMSKFQIHDSVANFSLYDTHVNMLNIELDNLKNNIDISVRPGQNIQFDDSLKYHQILTIHVNFWYIKMKLNNKYLKQENSIFASYCVNSAREILKLSFNLNRKYGYIFNWNCFYVVSAFIVIFYNLVSRLSDPAINKCIPEQLRDDTECLLKVSIKFFKNSSSTFETLVNQMVKIVLSMINRENSAIGISSHELEQALSKFVTSNKEDGSKPASTDTHIDSSKSSVPVVKASSISHVIHPTNVSDESIQKEAEGKAAFVNQQMFSLPDFLFDN